MPSFFLNSLVLCLTAGLRAAAEPTLRTVYQFSSNDTWLENVAVRSNGIVLTTEIGPPANLLAFNATQEDAEPTIVASFDSILGLSGITEVTPDVFYITGANTTSDNIQDPPKNATHVWRVDFTASDDEPAVTLVARPTTPLTDYNGLAAYNETIVLASASFQGSIYALDVATGDTWQAFEDDLMAGINGIKVQDGYVYWTSGSDFVRAEIDAGNFTVGAGELVALSSTTFDDFALSPDGFVLGGNATYANGTKFAYAATAGYNSVMQIAFDVAAGTNETSIIAGSLNSTEVAEPTGVAFGRAEGQLNKICELELLGSTAIHYSFEDPLTDLICHRYHDWRR